MVTKIDPPKEDSMQVFNQILKERKHHLDFYKCIEDDWRANLELYIKHRGDPEHVAPLELSKYVEGEENVEARKKSLIGLYNPPKGKTPYEILSKMRREHGLICCPACGEAGVPGTLDHYLPKDKFPELSILLVNLTPMCSECQRVKRLQYITSEGLKKYIHPYYDEINISLYSVTFSPPYRSPKFTIQINSDLAEILLDLVNEHIRGIELDLRFKRFCNTKYIHLLKMAKRHRSNESVDLSTMIKTSLQSEEDKSINCWEAVFYRSVLKDSDLLEYLKNGDLPNNI